MILASCRRTVTRLLMLGGVFLAVCTAHRAAAEDVMSLVRASHWADAEAAASTFLDPVVRKLVTYYRLLSPNAASAAEVAAFMGQNPDWPLQGSLARRRDEALAGEPDDTVAAPQCEATPPLSSSSLLRCADASAHAGRPGHAVMLARQAWIETPDDAAAEARVLQRWGSAVTQEDQWQRFDRLAWGDGGGAKRQATRLPVADRPRAEARMALRHDDASAPTMLAGLPREQRGEPTMILELARWLRRAGQDNEAAALWQNAGNVAERAAPADRLAAFWDERNILSRRLLRIGNAAAAYAIAREHAQQAPEQVADAEFLAGFIALRRLGDPTAAAKHFQALTEIGKAAITQGRAHYWLARAAAAGGDARQAALEDAAAADWPTTFYGQVAAVMRGDDAAALAARIVSRRDPPGDADRALDLAGREVARAAAYLVGWGEPRRAQAFLLRLAEIAHDPIDQALAARLAQGFAMPEVSIAIARRAGREGLVLLDGGWPVAASVPAAAAVEPALILGVIRQESSFDPMTVSQSGARGLMQLMPGTAAQAAHGLGLPESLPALTADSGYNLRLGTAYLRSLLDLYDGSVPLAIAAYNAGPTHVSEWLASYGDPRTGAVAMLDWIELIPFSETRNYVQRVIESEVVYRARLGEAKPHPLAQSLAQGLPGRRVPDALTAR